MEQESHQLNDHNKQEHPPMHTAEHILNQTMIRLFGCGRAISAHIERKKSKCDYLLSQEPSPEEIKKIEQQVNEIIQTDYPVTYDYISREDAIEKFDMKKLPADATHTLRVVYVGDYDACLCVGTHVEKTSDIGTFIITTTDYIDGVFRIRFKIK